MVAFDPPRNRMTIASDIRGGFSSDRQGHLGDHVGGNRNGQMEIIELISTVELNGYRTPNRWVKNFGLSQVARIGPDDFSSDRPA